jgi:hypothetical protein
MPDDTWGALAEGLPAWFNTDDFEYPGNVMESGYGISELKPWVMNQQPAHISALADQFVNAQTLLATLASTIRTHSETLYNETWTHSAARDEFMRRGPGSVLAYLQGWHDDLGENVRQLRLLVEPIQTSQTRMEALYQEYKDMVAMAKDESNIGFWEYNGVVNPNWHDYINPLSIFNDDAEVQNFLIERVRRVKEDYDRRARELVRDLNGAYEDAFFWMRYGVGATYAPPNVVMVPPGQDLPHLPSMAPPAMPGILPSAPPAVAPPALPVLPQPAPALAVPPGPPAVAPPALPNAPVPPVPTTVPGGPPAAPALPGQAGGPVALPPPAPGFGGTKLPGPAPGLGGSFAPGALPGTAGLPGGAPGLGNGMVPPPGLGRGLAKGVLRNPGAPPVPGGTPGGGVLPPPGAGRLGTRRATPGSTLRSPAAMYTQTGTPGVPGGPGSGMLPPPAPGSRRRQPGGMPPLGRGPLDVPEAFSRGSMPPPVSPVLGRPAPRRRTDQPVSPTGQRGSFAPPVATPPVLDASTARPGGMSLPPGGIPPQRSRRDRRQQGTPAGLPGNPNWLAETGPDESASTAPVLRNQVTAPDTGMGPAAMLPPQPGATAPVLGRPREAVRQAMAQNRSRPAGRRPTDAELELARRIIEADAQGRPFAEALAPREGEEAFTVQTPGGPVVGSSGPAQPEPAPKPLIGNS